MKASAVIHIGQAYFLYFLSFFLSFCNLALLPKLVVARMEVKKLKSYTRFRLGVVVARYQAFNSV